MSNPEMELIMVPSDGRFLPYELNPPKPTSSATNGRIFVLKFQSSTQRHIFWLQSKSQHPKGDPSWYSPRDLKLGQIVDRLLQGDEVNVQEEVASLSNEQGGNADEDGDFTSQMEDVRSEGQSGVPRDDSGDGDQGSRDVGADGGRA